jgi:hypothetical protein
MKQARGHGRGRGLRPEDLSLIFPDADPAEGSQKIEPDAQPQRPRPAAPLRQHDYKKAQGGDREDLPDPEAEEQGWPVEDLESENAPPAFEEPWPSEQDAPDADPTEGLEDPPAPDPDGEINIDPGRERRAAVETLAKVTSATMIDGAKELKPQPPKRIHGELQPSDKSWLMELRRIFSGSGLFEREERRL